MAQGKSPRSPLAFASVLCPGRCLASHPIHLGSEVEQYPSDGVPCTPRKEAQGLPSSSGFSILTELVQPIRPLGD